MMKKQVNLFIDRKPARGGGQVVLENLLAQACGMKATHLLTSEALKEVLVLPTALMVHTELGPSLKDAVRGASLTIVVNAISDLAAGLWAARSLSSSTSSLELVAILHSYPRSWVRKFATESLLKRYQRSIVVEPGLISLDPRAEIPPWLSIPRAQVSSQISFLDSERKVKCFARPDRPKGLDLLPKIFRELTTDGITCEVALGQPLEKDYSYQKRLRQVLDPWLVDGARGPEWLNPGDIFVIPSRAGEAACLSAQEAMARGCAVAASRIGLMPYLMPIGGAVRTFEVEGTSHAVEAIRDLARLGEKDYQAACAENQRAVAERSGLWYDYVLQSLELA